jgi:hypothetical protein
VLKAPHCSIASSAQGFFFNDKPRLQFGLVQLEGGPCGVLAGVQAHVLANLQTQVSSCMYRWLGYGWLGHVMMGMANKQHVVRSASAHLQCTGRSQRTQA